MANRIEEQIDKYLLNQMDEKSMSVFETELIKDEGLKNKFEVQKAMIESIESEGAVFMKNKLKGIHEKEFGQQSNNYLKYILIFSIVVVLGIVASKFLLEQKMAASPENIYLAYFEPYDYNSNTRAASESSIFNLVELYQNRNYEEFVVLGNKYLANNENVSSDILLAMGIATLEQNKPKEAIAHFTKITAKGDFNFEDEVRWYSALAYIRQEEYQDAISTLLPITKNKTADHHVESREVLKYLYNLLERQNKLNN